MQRGLALVSAGNQGRAGKRVEGPAAALGFDLADAREETFCRLVCDGMSQSEAFRLAGFKGANSGPSRLWAKPGIQERAAAILKARAETGAVTLPQVTDMLQRVFSGALASADWGPAHNAAFSLARLYGLVIDRATIVDLRRPSRDPDAPAETALADWVASLPALPSPAGPGPESPAAAAASPPRPEEARATARAPSPDAETSGLDSENKSKINELSLGPQDVNAFISDNPNVHSLGPSGLDRDLSNDFNGLAGLRQGPDQFGNGAPTPAVTGTPSTGARFGYEVKYPEVIDLIAETDGGTPNTPPIQKRVPRQKKQRVVEKRGIKTTRQGKRILKPRIPSAKDLFG